MQAESKDAPRPLDDIKFVPSTLVEQRLIRKIAERAHATLGSLGYSKVQAHMDIAACHLNGCPLRLDDLLNADEFNFLHDISGIRAFIDRGTGKIADFFCPRFAKAEGRQ